MRLSPNSHTVVLVPIRSFHDAKSRLADVLSTDERRAMAHQMAKTVVAAAHDLPVRVVSDDAGVGDWAISLGVGVLAPGVRGLNQSIAAAFAEVRLELPSPDARVVIAHADLPLAHDLRVVNGPGVAIAPDRHRDGSNVMSIPASADFKFAYGPGSFELHQQEAARCGLTVTVIDDPRLGLDIDHPDDLIELATRQRITD